ncbi:MAG TPA: sigma-70 family RNA polymerase sigma factor [Anaerolineae bacterium]|jgi:RNA polymerase sigma-70 factor, ECF subfamily|nr:sigma-70 family RNA polymerase sigma factor [Anaerolineae bacterium]
MDQERAWIEQALQGDRKAFGQLVRAYERPVYNLTYRMLGDPAEAEDAAQETFLRAYAKLATYQPGRKFVNWVLSIASHHCIDRLRRRQRAPQLSLDGPSPPVWLASDAPQPDQVVSKKEQRERVRRVLDALPPDYRAAVVLRYWYDLSYREIAETMDTTESAIKSRLHRARQMMAESLQAA